MQTTESLETRAQLGVPSAVIHSNPVAARFLPPHIIAACDSFRAACVVAWENRANPHLQKRTLAELCGLYAPHVSDYFHVSASDTKGNGRRSLPAEHIHAVEQVLGNRAISQFLSRLAQLTLMEEVIASRTA